MTVHRNDRLRYAANLIGFSTGMYFVVYFMLSFLVGLILPLFYKGATLASPLAVPEWVMGFVNLLLSQGSLAAAFITIRVGAPAQLGDKLSFAWPRDKKLWLFAPIFLAIGIFTNVCTTLLARLAVSTTKYIMPQPVALPNSAAALVIYFIAICAVPAFMEELLVRGAMQGLLQHWGPWFAILVSSALFTLLHGDIVAMPSIFILSIILGLTAYCTQSVVPGMLLHFANNMLAFFILLMGQKGDSAPAQVFTVYIIAVIVVAAVICVTLAAKAKAYKCVRQIPRFHDPKNRQSRFERLVCSPIYISMMMLLLVRAVLPLVRAQ